MIKMPVKLTKNVSELTIINEINLFYSLLERSNDLHPKQRRCRNLKTNHIFILYCYVIGNIFKNKLELSN